MFCDSITIYLFQNQTINFDKLLIYILDKLTLMYNERHVPLLRTQIAWESDKNIKYQNPEHSKGNLKEGILFNHLI